tara:strand:- start:294 stop:623 length:330 start_codon:yes stop_codon:yes gene_type:complete
MVLPDFYKGYHKEGAAMRKTKVKSTKGGQKQKLSNVPMPKAKPKFKGNTDALGNRTNLKTKASYKAMGGMAKYYEGGGEVMSGREGLTAAQKTLPDFLQKKILQAKKKK